MISKETKTLEVFHKGRKANRFGRRVRDIKPASSTGGNKVHNVILGSSLGARGKAAIKHKVVEANLQDETFPATIIIHLKPDDRTRWNRLRYE